MPLHAQSLTACCGLLILVTYSVVLCKTQCDDCLGVSFKHLFDPVLHDITDVPPSWDRNRRNTRNTRNTPARDSP